MMKIFGYDIISCNIGWNYEIDFLRGILLRCVSNIWGDLLNGVVVFCVLNFINNKCGKLGLDCFICRVICNYFV